MIEIKPNEVCPYSNNCKYNTSLSICQGSKIRNTTFTCTFVNDSGKISENKSRLQLDKNGKMQILYE